MAQAQAAQRAALVAGASGLTGGMLLQQLLESGDYARVHALSRRPLPLDHPRLANRILQFDALEQRLAGLRCHDAFCTLGAAGGPRAASTDLRHVDLGLVIAFARAARSAGADRLVVVSAAGADSAAAGAFLRTKGEVQTALRELQFPALDILQPGAVVGSRPGEGLAALLHQTLRPLANSLLRGSREAARAIAGDDLAAAMLGAARSGRRGVNFYTGGKLLRLADTGRRTG